MTNHAANNTAQSDQRPRQPAAPGPVDAPPPSTRYQSVRSLLGWALILVLAAAWLGSAGCDKGSARDGARPGAGVAVTPIDVAAAMQGDLVVWRAGKLQAAPATQLDGVSHFALYYSASWCPPCRQFTPQLVKWYNSVKKAHPEFEIVYVSFDNNAPDMADYMQDDAMPWPAIDFDKIKAHPELLRYAGDGIPCLVLIDAQGQVLADTYVNGEYEGPQTVVESLKDMFAKQATKAQN